MLKEKITNRIMDVSVLFYENNFASYYEKTLYKKELEQLQKTLQLIKKGEDKK